MQDKTPNPLSIDEVGPWSEIKLDIIRDYAREYSKILAAQTNPSFSHVYIDAFAGAGVHFSRTTQQFIPGSPLNAFLVDPPFSEYHLIDINKGRVENLKSYSTELGKEAFFYNEDCNQVLLNEVFPRVRYENYRRGLCILDPYGLHLDWEVIETAGAMGTIEIFLNFPIADINRNALRKDKEKVEEKQAKRMTRFWGNESWEKLAYKPSKQSHLFDPDHEEKVTNQELANAFKERLKKIAGFDFVPDPIPMKNTIGATVYYLYFASKKAVAQNIVRHIFDKYKNRK